jgi:hypothetical protein
VIESLANRHAYMASIGRPKTVRQMLHSGFYGPINRDPRTGEFRKALAEVDRDPRLRERMQDAMRRVQAGADKLKGFTDRGLATDPNGPYILRHEHMWSGGNLYGDWGGGRKRRSLPMRSISPTWSATRSSSCWLRLRTSSVRLRNSLSSTARLASSSCAWG